MFNHFKLYFKQALKIPGGNFNTISLILNYYPWKLSLQKGRSPLIDSAPWMTFDAINFLKENIKREMRIFEYGTGGSSVFFSRLSQEVVSVEHDKEWFLSVKKRMEELGINNWRGFLREPEKVKPLSSDSSNPDAYSTSDVANINFSFENYVKSIDQFSDNYFDLIVVDGRSRPSCIKHGIPKLKHDGFILLDNADRENYSVAIKRYLSEAFVLKVGTYGPTSHNPDFTITKIWQKI